MSGQKSRSSSVMYFLSSNSSKPGVFIESGCLYNINSNTKEFTVAVYHDDYRKFRIRDFEVIVFKSKQEAQEKINSLPKVGQRVFYLMRDKRMAVAKTVSDVYVPYVFLETGEKVHFEDLNEILFLSREDASAALNS